MSVEPGASPRATVAVVTCNRRDELRRALASAKAQSVACELLVVDDGSDDGTPQMVAAEFPEARLLRAQRREGALIGRNRAVAAASTPVVFFLDDDAEFAGERVVEQTLPAFDTPEAGAVSIPNLDDVNGELEWRVRPALAGAQQVVLTFVGCAHAVRRSAFTAIGGYRESMSNYGEETELALRLLDRGFVVLLGSSDPVHHRRSPAGRSQPREIRSRTRNTFLTALLLTPARALPGYLLLLLAYVPFDVLRDRHPMSFLAGLTDGFREAWRQRTQRKPIGIAAFRLAERLRRHEPLPIEEVRASLHMSARA